MPLDAHECECKPHAMDHTLLLAFLVAFLVLVNTLIAAFAIRGAAKSNAILASLCDMRLSAPLLGRPSVAAGLENSFQPIPPVQQSAPGPNDPPAWDERNVGVR